MEIFGGFMVMMSIVTLFLAVVWLIMPFVVFAIKGKQDRTLEVLESMDKRLAAIEARFLTDTPVPAMDELQIPEQEPVPASECRTEYGVAVTTSTTG
ncbi:MAG TPA: hypothetical protein HPP76_12225 [Desulfuromonadales bacterium]|nr:hypothetical protein [Desulfuromonadales bacterium]